MKDSGDAEAAAAPASSVVDTPGTVPATTGSATDTEPAPAETETAEPAEPTSTGITKLDAALAKRKIVVVVVYSPDGNVDTLQVSDARAGAADVNVGFLALNGLKEKDIAAFATAYDVRVTPTVLVFRRGPAVVARFDSFVDRKTVAQAAQNARQA